MMVITELVKIISHELHNPTHFLGNQKQKASKTKVWSAPNHQHGFLIVDLIVQAFVAKENR